MTGQARERRRRLRRRIRRLESVVEGWDRSIGNRHERMMTVEGFLRLPRRINLFEGEIRKGIVIHGGITILIIVRPRYRRAIVTDITRMKEQERPLPETTSTSSETITAEAIMELAVIVITVGTDVTTTVTMMEGITAMTIDFIMIATTAETTLAALPPIVLIPVVVCNSPISVVITDPSLPPPAIAIPAPNLLQDTQPPT